MLAEKLENVSHAESLFVDGGSLEAALEGSSNSLRRKQPTAAIPLHAPKVAVASTTDKQQNSLLYRMKHHSHRHPPSLTREATHSAKRTREGSPPDLYLVD